MKRRALRTGARLVSTVAAMVLFSEQAPAEGSNDEESARALFREGRTLAGAGHYDEACTKFEESLKLDVGIGTEFNLADCYEHSGRLLRARALFLKVAEAAHEFGQGDREELARTRAKALDERIPRVAIEAREKIDGFEVRLDGHAVDRSNGSAGERVEPGPHDISANAPHKKTWSLHVDVPPSSTTLTITVPKLEDDTSNRKVAPPTRSKAKTPERASSVSRAPKPTANKTLKILLLGGAGAGAVLAGTSFVLYKLRNDDAKGVCPTSNGCTEEDVQRHDGFVNDAARARALGYVGLGVAGAGLAGFAVVSLLSPGNRETPREAAVRAAPILGDGTFGASVQGRF